MRLSTSAIQWAPSSSPSLTSMRARLVACTSAPWSFASKPDGKRQSSSAPDPSSSPPKTSRCFHRGDRSSAPLTTAVAHSSVGMPPPIGICPGSGGLAVPSLTSRSCWRTARQAEWKRPITRWQVRRPSGRSHIAGADRSCETRSWTFSGFVRVVRSDAAVPSNLSC